MIWLFVSLVVLAYFLVFCLMRAAAQADERIVEMARRVAAAEGDEPRIYVREVRTPYDWEERGDFPD